MENGSPEDRTKKWVQSKRKIGQKVGSNKKEKLFIKKKTKGKVIHQKQNGKENLILTKSREKTNQLVKSYIDLSKSFFFFLQEI